MRRHRASTSWSVWLSAWPMCNDPVTLGGGMTIEKIDAWESGFDSGAKNRWLSQNGYHRSSTSFGSYAFGISIVQPPVNLRNCLSMARRHLLSMAKQSRNDNRQIMIVERAWKDSGILRRGLAVSSKLRPIRATNRFHGKPAFPRHKRTFPRLTHL